MSLSVVAETPRPVPSSYHDSWTSFSWASIVSRLSSLSVGGREGEREVGKEGGREEGREGGGEGGRFITE